MSAKPAMPTLDRPAFVGPGNEIGEGFYAWWQSVEARDWEQLEQIALADMALARWIADGEDGARDLISVRMPGPSLVLIDPLAFAHHLQIVLRERYADDIDRACKMLTEWTAHQSARCARDCPYCEAWCG